MSQSELELDILNGLNSQNQAQQSDEHEATLAKNDNSDFKIVEPPRDDSKEVKGNIPQKDQVNITDKMEATEIESVSFNEVDYAAMLINTHIRMAVRNLIKEVTFSNKIVGDLRTVIMNDDSGDIRGITSKLFKKYPGANFDEIYKKLDFYNTISDRAMINSYLTLLNTKIKKNILNKSLTQYFKDNDTNKLLDKIDKLTNDINGAVIPFTDLNNLKLDEVKNSFNPAHKLESCIKKINILSYYKALLKGQLFIVAAPPGVGKTQFLINEVYFHARNGYKVAYLAMGDSLESDFMIKLGCIHFGVKLDEFIQGIDKYIADPEFQKVRSNIKLSVVSAGELNSGDVRKIYSTTKDLLECDVYVFDYDSNFQDLQVTDMYKAHDIIYNNVYSLARLANPKLVYIASQVKTGYYNMEFIPLDGLAESNRKGAIADVIITISSNRSESANCGIINIVKARRGRLGFTPFYLDKSGKINEINMDVYRQMKAQISSSNDTQSDGSVITIE